MSTFPLANFDIKSRILYESQQWHHNSPLRGQPISNIMDFCNLVARFFKSDESVGDKWIFRGESHLFDKPLTPSIFRDEFNFTRNKYPEKTITDQEIDEIERCQLRTTNGHIKDRYLRAFLPEIRPEDVNWLPLARHFGFKTRLLLRLDY